MLLRICWPLLSRRLRRVLIALAISAILFQVLIHVFKWSPTPTVYRLVSWVAVAGYVFLHDSLDANVSTLVDHALAQSFLFCRFLAPTLLFPLSSLFADTGSPDTQLQIRYSARHSAGVRLFGGTSGVDR